MPFTATLAQFDSDLWGFHITVPSEIAEQFIEGKNRRVICTLNDTLEFQCALMHHGDDLKAQTYGKYFININKENRKKLGLKIGSEVQVSLQKDESKYGMPMPEEMQELLYQDPEGDKLFHALTPGKQRSLLYIVGKPKRSETRLTKAIVVVEHLKSQGGKIDYKQLNQDFKDYKPF